jgi:hypothetical protein
VPGLAGYFDLGFSCGLTDEVFQADIRRTDTAIGMVGIDNPLGDGLSVDLLRVRPDLLQMWLDQAIRQIYRPEVDIGQSSGLDRTALRAQQERLRSFVSRHPVASCTLIVYPLGIGFLRITFGPAAGQRLVAGLLTVYEYAAYRPEFAALLLSASTSVIASATSPDATRAFITMSARPVGGKQQDATGYEQSNLFSSFTRVVRLADPAGDDHATVAASWGIDRTRVIDFEYHGLLYYSWSICLLVPHGKHPWTPEQELARIEACICIAHVASGACEALLRLCEDEVKRQAESFVTNRRSIRGSRELNRLRILSLAVVTLTDLRRVTACEEDQAYFRWYAEDAGLQRNQQLITESVELLYNVQDAEVQREHSTRERILNGILAVLASLTLVSVSADAYNFLSGATSIISRRTERAQLLFGFLAVVMLLAATVLWVQARPPRALRTQSARSKSEPGRPGRGMSGKGATAAP